MRWWSHLTGRGRALLIAGALVSGVAAAVGERQILSLALVLALLPLAALLVGAIARPSISCERQLSSARTSPGQDIDVVLGLEQRRAVVPLLVEFEEVLSPELGPRPGFAAGRLTGPWRRRVSYRIPARNRGIFTVGPLRFRTGDALGLTSSEHSCQGQAELAVLPHIVELPSLRLGSSGITAGEQRPHHLAVSGHEDVLVREHHVGDGMRRVHWRSSARHGTLMVRREDSSLDESATILLDSRAQAYATPERFEWAVSAAASAALRLVDQGFRVTILDSCGPVVVPVHDNSTASKEDILLALTRAQLTATAELRFTGSASATARIAILGRIAPGDAARLIAVDQHVPGWALLLDGSAASAEVFQSQGWRALTVPPAMAVDAAWRRLGGLR